MPDTELVTPTAADLDAMLGDPEHELDESKHTHIVLTPKGVSAQAVVDAAKIQQTPLTALCGYVWVPRSNPDNHPVCQKCLDVLDAIRAGRPES